MEKAGMWWHIPVISNGGKPKIGDSQPRMAWAKSEIGFPKQPEQGLEVWLKQQSTCLATLKP
jgi:hypothetical protein